MRDFVLAVVIGGVLVWAGAARAEDRPNWREPLEEPPAAEQACPVWSIQFLSGYYLMTGIGPNDVITKARSELDYLPQVVRLGCECPCAFLPGTCLEGRWQILLEANFSFITRQFGNYFTGPSAILRYNYRRENSWVIPYLQGGAGLLLTDSHQDMQQRFIGQAVEFLLRVEGGVRFLVSEHWSLDVEGGLQHVSNANLASRNGGINDVGISVGFTYEFGKSRKR